MFPLRAEKPEILQRAWQEYQFLSMDAAKNLFKQAQKLDTSAEYLLEAKVGLAMVSQFREQKSDLNVAEALYREVLAENPPEELRDLVYSFIADLHISRGENEEALEMLDKLIESNLNSVVGQDALIRKTLLTMGEYGAPQSVKVADETETILAGLAIEPTAERPYLIPLLESLLGDIYFWSGDFTKALAHYEIFTTLGNAKTTSYGSQAGQLYQIAKLYEVEMEDPKKAGQFYKRLITEYPNNGTSYFALEKAVRLGAMSRKEVEKLRLSGVTSEILDELFETSKEGKN
ncbi:tetratricopeptide repeat protein [Kiritimatiellaeota bacterium B1221]|nr:tetratricopeptide repeat protein [Kiritimatiellaeota bacterium B1221]